MPVVRKGHVDTADMPRNPVAGELLAACHTGPQGKGENPCLAELIPELSAEDFKKAETGLHIS